MVCTAASASASLATPVVRATSDSGTEAYTRLSWDARCAAAAGRTAATRGSVPSDVHAFECAFMTSRSDRSPPLLALLLAPRDTSDADRCWAGDGEGGSFNA